MLLTPLHHALVIPAFMQRVEVWPRRFFSGNPGVGDDAHVGVTSQFLPEHFDTVILGDGQISRMIARGDCYD